MNAPIFKILTTENLTLRQLSPDDRQDIMALRSDPEINKYLDRSPCKTIEEAISFIQKINENIEKHHALYWAITLTATQTFVGTICLFEFSREQNSCEIGYELMTKFQGQGIMKEAMQTVIEYAFLAVDCNKIFAITHCGNEGSTRLLVKFNLKKKPEPDEQNPELNTYILIKQKGASGEFVCGDA